MTLASRRWWVCDDHGGEPDGYGVASTLYEDGIRFASEDLHVSAWLKGIRRIVVVGRETPLTVAGEATSIGRLLLGPIQYLTVEQTQVMLKSEEDGEVRSAQVGSRLRGVPLTTLLDNCRGPPPSWSAPRRVTSSCSALMGCRVQSWFRCVVQVTLAFPDRGTLAVGNRRGRSGERIGMSRRRCWVVSVGLLLILLILSACLGGWEVDLVGPDGASWPVSRDVLRT